jgi:hypothetical protein
MKSFGKYFSGGFHINPINRDLILVVTLGMIIAMSIITLMMMIISSL